MTEPTIRRLAGEEILVRLDELAEVLLDCVEGGASVSFMWPLPRERALAFWRGVGESVAGDERLLLVAEAEGRIVGTVQLLLDQPPNRLGPGLDGHQFHLRAGVLEHRGSHRMPLVVVAVQEPVRRPAGHRRRQLPSQVERILDTEVQALPAGRRMNVGCVAREQYPAGPVALGQPRRVAEARQPAR